MRNQQKISQIYQWPTIGKESVWRQFHPLPPFTFHGVTARIFPLQADIDALDDFCGEYLNLVPPHIAQFRPAAPFVYLSVLHYEEMSSQPESQKDQRPVSVSPEQASAWVSQYEVVFIVPLERYRKEGGEMVFKNWAFAGPFIFVSDPISVTLGREVYGWQKLAARIEPDFDDWIVHPRNRSHLLTLSTSDAPLVSVLEKKEDLHPLLKIEVEPPPSFSQLRPDRNPFALLLDAPRTVLDGLGTMVDWLDVFAGLPMWGSALMSDRQERRNRQEQVRKVAEGLKNLGFTWSHLLRDQALTALFPDFSSYEKLRDILQKASGKSTPAEEQPRVPLFLDQFTLKQFYNANVSQYACYQALVQSRIEIIKQRNGGLLGDINYLLSDPSGGFRISIYRGESEGDKREFVGNKIIKALGLKTEKEDKIEKIEKRQSDGSFKPEKIRVAVLKPFYPFWTQADLRYGEGRTLCWRTAEGEESWNERDELSEAPGDDPKSEASKLPPRSATGDRDKALQAKKYGPKFPTELPLRYVTIGGALEPPKSPPPSQKTAAVSWNKGQELSLSLTIRVYPLEITGNREEQESRVKEFVKILRMGQLFENLKGVTFQPAGSYVYLIVMNESDDQASRETPWEVAFAVPVIWRDGDKSALALFSPFVFVEADNAVIIEREVTGQPTVDATLTTTDSWLREDKLGKESYLTLKTKIIPDPDAEAKDKQVEEKELLIIEQPHTNGEPKKWKYEDNLENLAKAQVLALEILTEKRPVRSIMLKWFLDARNPEQDTCYQAVVTTRRTISDVHVSKVEGDAKITIYKYGHYPIVTRLGLVHKPEQKDGREVARLTPISPFSITVKMKEEPAMDAYQRLHDEEWKPTPFSEAAIDSPDPKLGKGVLDFIDPQKQNFKEAVVAWEKSNDKSILKPKDIQSAMTVDPFEVIKSIVNGKWMSKEVRDRLRKQKQASK